jgi:hypothetical protein
VCVRVCVMGDHRKNSDAVTHVSELKRKAYPNETGSPVSGMRRIKGVSDTTSAEAALIWAVVYRAINTTCLLLVWLVVVACVSVRCVCKRKKPITIKESINSMNQCEARFANAVRDGTCCIHWTRAEHVGLPDEGDRLVVGREAGTQGRNN